MNATNRIVTSMKGTEALGVPLKRDQIGAMGSRTFAAHFNDLAGPAWSDQRVAVASIAGAWGLYLTFVAVRLAIARVSNELLIMPWHVLTAIAGAGLAWIFFLALRRLAGGSILLRITVALILAVPLAMLLALVNYNVLFVVAPSRVWPEQFLQTITWRGVIAHTIAELYFVFVAWATLYISVSSALESQDAQRRAAISQAESRDAQLRALRYQLNPHFLFNALNTVSALVMEGDADGAEETIQALSQFLRSTLVTDSIEDATLAEELKLQLLYLAIEKARYGNRLRVHVSVPDALQAALLPPLLLQPLVENVICHAVAPARKTVTMTITASAQTDGLHVVVEDDGLGGGVREGYGIGLSNAASRLSARFGEAARCGHGPRPCGGYRVELVLPLRMAISRMGGAT